MIHFLITPTYHPLVFLSKFSRTLALIQFYVATLIHLPEDLKAQSLLQIFYSSVSVIPCFITFTKYLYFFLSGFQELSLLLICVRQHWLSSQKTSKLTRLLQFFFSSMSVIPCFLLNLHLVSLSIPS